MARILIISFSNLASDPRVNRQIRFLSERHQVVAAGTRHPGIPDTEFVELTWGAKPLAWKVAASALLLTKAFTAYYWAQPDVLRALKRLRNVNFDLVIANDLDTLPLALKLAGKRPVFFDAHEYFPGDADEKFKFRLLRPYRVELCRRFLPAVAAMTTVCEALAHAYNESFGVSSHVITNSPDFQDLRPSLNTSSPIRLVHHGIGAPSRGLEKTLDLMRHLNRDRYELHFYLVPGDQKYINRLQKQAEEMTNVFFHAPVPMRRLPQELNQYDIGVFLLEPVNFNYANALPNKFFEFVQARLAIAIGPSPEMARYLERYELGVKGPDFTPRALAQAITNITRDQLQKFKMNSHQHAHALSASSNRDRILQLTESLLGSHPDNAK